ncbi:MAG: hypothetical protein ACXAD7_12320 [Candidatus Kariarchaeaceae archaeon]|jgi:hypothetical protein
MDKTLIGSIFEMSLLNRYNQIYDAFGTNHYEACRRIIIGDWVE